MAEAMSKVMGTGSRSALEAQELWMVTGLPVGLVVLVGE
jgi:hypothetical protein